MKRILETFLLTLCYICGSDAIAAQSAFQAGNLNKWQGAYWKLCGQHSDEDQVRIGDSMTTQTNMVNPQKSDEKGIIMMVARDTTEGGAYFCPTVVMARNTDEKFAWTEYYSPGGECVWLCRKGYTGDKCSKKDTSQITECDTTKLLRDNYRNVHIVGSSSTNIEDTIPNWGANYYDACNYPEGEKVGSDHVKGQEHDLIFVISNWLQSGRGAFVKPYMVRAVRNGWNPMSSYLFIYPAASIQYNNASNTTAMLGCKNGFKPNANNNDCIPINNDVCGVQVWCDGWNESRFKKEKHVEVKVGNCLQWRCSESGQGLVSAGAENCTPCGDSAQIGIHPKNGTCHICPDGKIFSATAPGYCSDAYYVDRNMLMYGAGSQSDDVGDQCWTMVDLNDYKSCVIKAVKANY